MAGKLAEHYIEIKAKLDKFDSGMSKVQKTMKGLDKRTATMQKQMAGKFAPAMKKAHGATTGLNRGLSSMAKRLIAIGVAYFGARAVFRMSKSFLEVASSVEQFRLRLESLLGSQKAAADAMDYFNDIAAKVPFTLQEIIESGTIITAMGADLKKWTPILTDLAAVMGMKLPEAASALGRAYAGGAGAADIFRERGILQIIKDSAKLKHSIDDITKLTLPEFRDVMFEAFTDPTGKMAGASAKLAKTWVGTISMLQDKWFQFRTTVMKAGIFELLKEGLASFDSKLDEFIKTGKLDLWAKDTAIAVINGLMIITEGIKGLIFAFQTLKAAIYGAIKDLTVQMRAYIEKLIIGFGLLEKLGVPVKKILGDLVKEWASLVTEESKLNTVIEETTDKMAGILTSFDKLKAILNESRKAVEKSKGAIKDLGDKTKETTDKITTSIASLPKSIIPPAAITMAKMSLEDFDKWYKEWLEGLKEKWEKALQDKFWLANYFVNQVSAIFSQFSANRMQQIDNEYEAGKTAIENSILDEEAKAEALEALDKEMETKRKKAARSQAIMQKAAALAAAGINIAVAITKALTLGPFLGIAAATWVKALGAVQLALIAATPLPPLQKGGLIPRPMPVMAGHGPKGEIISQPAALAKIITQEMPRQMATEEATGFPRRPQQINLRVKFDDFHGIKFREQVVKIVVDEADKGMYTIPGKVIR